MKFLLKAKWTWPGNPFLPENPDFKTGQRHASNLSPNLPTKIVFHIFWCMLEILGLEFDLTVVSISRLHCHAIKKFNSWPARTCKLETEVHTLQGWWETTVMRWSIHSNIFQKQSGHAPFFCGDTFWPSVNLHLAWTFPSLWKWQSTWNLW